MSGAGGCPWGCREQRAVDRTRERAAAADASRRCRCARDRRRRAADRGQLWRAAACAVLRSLSRDGRDDLVLGEPDADGRNDRRDRGHQRGRCLGAHRHHGPARRERAVGRHHGRRLPGRRVLHSRPGRCLAGGRFPPTGFVADAGRGTLRLHTAVDLALGRPGLVPRVHLRLRARPAARDDRHLGEQPARHLGHGQQFLRRHPDSLRRYVLACGQRWLAAGLGVPEGVGQRARRRLDALELTSERASFRREDPGPPVPCSPTIRTARFLQGPRRATSGSARAMASLISTELAGGPTR